MLYYFHSKVILLFGKSYITFPRKLYDFCLEVILLPAEGYIPFDKKVYTFRPKGIYLFAARYIPFSLYLYRRVKKAFEEAVPSHYFASPRVMRKEAW